MNSDDVVFLIFLYQVRHLDMITRRVLIFRLLQRWIYRIDPKRVNEYGQVAEVDASDVNGESKKDR
jgi:hypothetical protein